VSILRTPADAVSVVAGRFEVLVGRGLASVLAEDTSVRVLESNLERVGLKRAVMQLAPQVVVLDEVNISLARCLMALAPAIGVVVLAREPTSTYGMVLLAAGVSCLADSASAADIATTVHTVGHGGCVFVSADAGRVKRPDRDPAGILTKRETQVLAGLSDDKSYAEIALELKISVTTVKKHAASLLGKLRASSKQVLIGMPILWDQSSWPVAGASSATTSASG
jgi:DNA-binding NarL/FixJ family response regulator